MTTTDKKRPYYFSVGKRKTAIARVRLYEGGSGDVTVNGKKVRDYFTRSKRRMPGEKKARG